MYKRQEEETLVSVYPCDAFKESSQVIRRKTDKGMWGIYQISVEKKEIDVSVKQTGPSRYVINIPTDNMKGLKAVSYTHLDVYKRQSQCRAGKASCRD